MYILDIREPMAPALFSSCREFWGALWAANYWAFGSQSLPSNHLPLIPQPPHCQASTPPWCSPPPNPSTPHPHLPPSSLVLTSLLPLYKPWLVTGLSISWHQMRRSYSLAIPLGLSKQKNLESSCLP